MRKAWQDSVTGITIKALVIWAIAFAMMAALPWPAQARNFRARPLHARNHDCAQPSNTFHQAMCSDPALRRLLRIGEHRMKVLVDRLSPALRQQLIADQQVWEASIVDECAIAPSSAPLPITGTARSCLLDANRSRLAWLGRYIADPTLGPPTPDALATPNPAASAKNGPPSPTAAPPVPAAPASDLQQPPRVQPDTRGITLRTSPLVWLIEIVAVLVALEVTVLGCRSWLRARERNRCAEGQQLENNFIRGYIENVNRSRRLPECDVPVRLTAGEFGVAVSPALRWTLQSHRATPASGWRPTPNSPAEGFSFEYKELDPLASGMLVITNRRVLFQSENHSFQCEHDTLLKVQYDRSHLQVFTREQPAAAIFSAERAGFMALLIDAFAQRRFPGGRLPEGNIVSARPNGNGGLVLSFEQAAPLGVKLGGVTAKDAA